ncbi:tumor protein p53-inducible nuclear protein 1 [Eucyclogobius newberryi]|uniref:tumor protein p53-inducible nuclear protein 1 n=1 Tax=Eucyclogobius newberryi TaxID=166745 RepID=UPI003B5CFB2E
MFQRFTSALFGADSSELRPQDSAQSEEDEDWILVNYMTDAGSSSVSPEDDEDLVMLPSPTAPPMGRSPMGRSPMARSPMARCPMGRCPSLTSLNSTTTEPDDLDAAADPNPDSDPDLDSDPELDQDFLCLEAGSLEAGSLEESWFVTPPACFTRAQPLPLEPSPLENLLIEHPSMSVYLLPLHSNNKPRPPHNNRPRQQTGLQRAQGGGSKPGSGKKEKRRTMDNRHRPEGIQRRPSSSCLSPAVSGRVDLLQPRPPHSLSKNALRRLNPQRPPKAAAPQLHQPIQRHLNF